MEIFSVLLVLWEGNSPVSGEFPTQRPVPRSFDVFFDLRLNKRLSKQSRGWWFDTRLRSLRCQCNEIAPTFGGLFQWTRLNGQSHLRLGQITKYTSILSDEAVSFTNKDQAIFISLRELECVFISWNKFSTAGVKSLAYIFKVMGFSGCAVKSAGYGCLMTYLIPKPWQIPDNALSSLGCELPLGHVLPAHIQAIGDHDVYSSMYI